MADSVLLIRQAQSGDVRAIAALLNQHAPALRYLVARSFPRSDQREDSMQELFAKLIAALPKFDIDGEAQFGTWVFSVAQNWLIDRSRKRQLKVVPLSAADQIVDPGMAPDNGAQDRQNQEALNRAIERLPDEQRRVFLLAQLYGQPLESIAAQEKVPLGTVKSRLHRARAELLHVMQAFLPEEITS